MSAPSARQRVAGALAGEAGARPATGPLAVHFCAADAGVSLEEYSTRAEVLADCVLRYHERYRPDAVWISADTWVTAEAMGAAVASPGPDQPLCGTGAPLVAGAADVERLPPPDPEARGRQPLMLEALRTVVRAIGDQTFVVACFDQLPFSLAAALMGPEALMLAMLDDPPLVAALLERCVEHSAAYAQALAAAGAHMLSGGDSPAGLIGPTHYREVALPAERAVFERLRATIDLPLSLHVCGDCSAILPDMATSGADVLEIDHGVDLFAACRAVGPDVALWGNLDPVGVLQRGDPAAVRRASEAALRAVRAAGHERFVLSSGCTLAVGTPEANLRAMLDAAHRWPDERDPRPPEEPR